MKLVTIIVAVYAATASQTAAQSAIVTLCGEGHANEIDLVGPISANPDGYYLAGHQIQLSHGDHRIILATGSEFYICTRPAPTPNMDETQAYQVKGNREVTFLFVPVAGCPTKPNS